MNKNDKTLLSKQKKVTGILCLLAVILLAAYVVITLVAKDPLNTVLKYDEDGDELYATITGGSDSEVTTSLITGYLESGKKSKYDVKSGETENVAYTFRAKDVNISYRPFIAPEVSLDDFSYVTVENKSGKFTVCKKDGGYYIDGSPDLILDSGAVSNLVLQSRYMLSSQKVENPSDNLADYGLSDSPVAKITVGKSDGQNYTVYLGDKSVSGGGYYMKHAEKPYVYVMDSSASVFEEPAVNLVSPVLAQSFTEEEYNYMESFSMKKNGSDFIKCVIVPESERTSDSTNLHKMTYPASYTPSMNSFYEALSCLAQPKGTSVLEMNVSKSSVYASLMDYYGFIVPTNEISYSSGEKNGHFLTGNFFTADDGKKYCYAYSEYQDIIVTLSVSDYPFLEYGLIDFIDPNIFRYNIENVQSISVSTPAGTKTFELSGSGKDLAVTERQSGKAIDTPSFRQMYISLLSISIEGYSDTRDTADLVRELSFTVRNKSGDETVYSFYTLSTLTCFVTVNGDGEFYTNRAYIEKVVNNVDMLMSGKEIKADY